VHQGMYRGANVAVKFMREDEEALTKLQELKFEATIMRSAVLCFLFSFFG
jgi:hypothetical protein